MAANRYAHVDFWSWNPENKQHEKICTVYLVDGKLSYEGEKARMVKKSVETNEDLDEYRKMGGYSLLAQMPHAFHGSYFYATDVVDATIL